LTFKDHWPPKSVIVVGRKSKWNSPFRCPKDGSPEEVLEKYRRHLVTAKLLRHLHELRGKNLVCCCSEKSRAPAMLSFCVKHRDFFVMLATELLSNSSCRIDCDKLIALRAAASSII
jgi:hypothetical protein